MVPYAGWEMPVYYKGIIEEYTQCRQKAAVFDISHMGEIIFEGDLVSSGLDCLFTCSLAELKPGKAKYTLVLNESGGILDDLIVFKIAEDKLMVVTNASTRKKIFEHINNNIKSDILKDISDDTAKIDIQGPSSARIINNVLAEGISLDYFNFMHLNYSGSEILVSRTGYTGEHGYELFIPAEKSGAIWNNVLRDGEAAPAGLGARNILRMEMGYSLYGAEIDEKISPIEAGLEFAVNYSSSFLGKEALLKMKDKTTLKKRIAFVTSSRRVPKQEWKILADGKEAGYVTSGTFSPALSRGIGMGYLKSDFGNIKTVSLAGERGINLDAEIIDIPFYRKGSLKN